MTFRAAFYIGTHTGIAGLYNRFARFWIQGSATHMEIVFSDGMSASSSFIDGGVRFKSIIFDPLKWDFVDLDPALERIARMWFIAHNGAKYDNLATLRFIWGFIRPSKDRWECVEACLTSLGYDDGWRFDPVAAQVMLSHSAP